MDADSAKLYGVETKRINEALKRNIDRFPEDFAFRLTKDEVVSLKSQFAASSYPVLPQILMFQIGTSSF